MKPIAHLYTDFKTKFGLPRQSGLIEEITGKIIFEKEYSIAEAFKGLEDFSHIWILWEFSEAKKETWKPTVRPPLLGGNKRMGVFATRSPFRPNSIGLSCVKLEKIDYDKTLGTVLCVSGCDLMNGTPIYDIKPYLPFADSHPDAVGGYADDHLDHRLDVIFPEHLLNKLPCDKRENAIGCLAEDPRPSYQEDESRLYHMIFSENEISFTVSENTLTVVAVT